MSEKATQIISQKEVVGYITAILGTIAMFIYLFIGEPWLLISAGFWFASSGIFQWAIYDLKKEIT